MFINQRMVISNILVDLMPLLSTLIRSYHDSQPLTRASSLGTLVLANLLRKQLATFLRDPVIKNN